MSNLDDSRADFSATRWSLVGALRAADESQRRAALDELVRRYWPPVYAYVRRNGANRDAAAELTQGFFAEVALGRRLFERADPNIGRLRLLMLRAVKNYLIDAHRRSRRDAATLPLTAEDILAEESRDGHACRRDRAASNTPEDAFHRRWAVAQLEEALRRTERRFVQSGRERHWRAFELRELFPASSGAEALPMADVAAQLGFPSAADAAAAVQTVRKRVLATLREIVAETVRTDDECADELSSVERYLSA